MSLLRELLFFFISSFLSFPLCIKRVVLCFIYLDDHKPSFIYPSLEEENLHTTCVVDVDPVSSLQSIGKNKIYISILPKHAQPYNLEDDKSELYPYQILSPFVIIVEPCHQFVKPHF
jgi:hypothetical protein